MVITRDLLVSLAGHVLHRLGEERAVLVLGRGSSERSATARTLTELLNEVRALRA
ncbi:hypothetical protein AB0B48_04415 [Micromonospora sp. NPDC049089]|uniref:hypothetical protein n=1 Tax=Micromonospora sp. NPDC049089 TaxID=3155496 RepID=UPI00340FEA20